eukprot:gene2940-biopygen11756
MTALKQEMRHPMGQLHEGSYYPLHSNQSLSCIITGTNEVNGDGGGLGRQYSEKPRDVANAWVGGEVGVAKPPNHISMHSSP